MLIHVLAATLFWTAVQPTEVRWQQWSNATLHQAKADRRLVLIDLEAVWCHWCHIMDETTYRDPAVMKLLANHYIAVRVDQDSNPQLTGAQRQTLQAAYLAAFDPKNGGFGRVHRLVDGDTFEYTLALADSRNQRYVNMAQKSLAGGRLLIDREWGGIYQYSTSFDWRTPHYEKIVSSQAEALTVFSEAYALLGDPADLKAAQAIYSYLTHYLADSSGGFYTSQDADLSAHVDGHRFYKKSAAERAKLGLPSIDRHMYGRENGWLVSAFCSLYAITDDLDVLTSAQHAAVWAMVNRELPDGGFRHGEDGPAELGDTVAMARGLVALYEVTGQRAWLKEAVLSTDYLASHFRHPKAGIVSVEMSKAGGVFAHPVRVFADNVAVARLANRLFGYTGKPAYRELAEHTMRYLASPDTLERAHNLAGVLLADQELSQPSLHLVVVGRKDDVQARALFTAARAYGAGNKRLEWWDRREGPLPSSEVSYPALERAAIYICTGASCSPPIFSSERLAQAIARISRPEMADPVLTNTAVPAPPAH